LWIITRWLRPRKKETASNTSYYQEVQEDETLQQQQQQPPPEEAEDVEEQMKPPSSSTTIAANLAVPATAASMTAAFSSNGAGHHKHYHRGGGGGAGGLHSLGVTDAHWRYHRELALETCRQMDPTDPRHQAVPSPYCNAYCLEPPKKTGRSSFGYPSGTFLVTNREDGKLYCLKRFDSVRSVSAKIASAVSDQWRSMPNQHPGTAALFQCFVAQRAVFFVHEYIPGARTLLEIQQQLAVDHHGQTTMW
jgi:hypothetical protein